MNTPIHTTVTKDKTFIIVVEPISAESFQELIQRGSNLWPDAPPAIKEFADIITNGKIMQDYRSQDTSKN